MHKIHSQYPGQNRRLAYIKTFLSFLVMTHSLFACKLPQNARHLDEKENDSVEILEVFDSNETSRQLTFLVLKLQKHGQSEALCLTKQDAPKTSDDLTPSSGVEFAPCYLGPGQQLFLEDSGSEKPSVASSPVFNFYHIKLAQTEAPKCLRFNDGSLEFAPCAPDPDQSWFLWRSPQEKNKVALAVAAEVDTHFQEVTGEQSSLKNVESAAPQVMQCLFIKELTGNIDFKNCLDATYFSLESNTL